MPKEIEKLAQHYRDVRKAVPAVMRKVTAAVIPVLFLVFLFVTRRVLHAYRRQRRLWRGMRSPYRLYSMGFCISVMWGVIGLFWPRSPVIPWILAIAGGLYVLALIIWAAPYIRHVATTWWWRWIFIVANAFILIFATFRARQVVQTALQLQPQYFDLTTGLVALLTYLPTAFTFFIWALGGLTVPLAAVWMMVQLVPTIFRPLIPFLGPKVGKKLSRMERRSNMRATKVTFYLSGVIAVVLFSAQILDLTTLALHKLEKGIRLFAYEADFQPAGVYPGVPCDGRSRLMDNGVVATAKIVEGDVKITTTIYPDQSRSFKSCEGGT